MSRDSDEALVSIGRLALREYVAWVQRNAARDALKRWRREACFEIGEVADLTTLEPEELAEHDALADAMTKAQRRLNTAKAATRRAAGKVSP